MNGLTKRQTTFNLRSKKLVVAMIVEVDAWVGNPEEKERKRT